MAIKEQDVVLVAKDTSGNKVIQMPITRVENVEGAIKTVNKVAPDAIGNVAINTVANATKATQDASGNVITATYATKTELAKKLNTSSAFTKAQANKLYLGKSAKATSASVADTATSATKATQDASGNVITTTYATKTEVTVGLSGKLGKTEKATSAITADTATSATKASQDAAGNDIPTTYATKAEVNTGLAGKANSSHTHTKSQITDFPTIPDAILKNGNRGAIAGYEQWTKAGATTTLNVSSGDSLLMEVGGAAATITVQAGSIGQIATKLVWVNKSNKSITINGSVGWFAGDVPTLNKASAVLLFFFHDDYIDCRLIGQWD